MTRFTSIALCAFMTGARAYDPIAMYVPATEVTDHALIDIDQIRMEVPLSLGSNAGYAKALRIYEEGGASKSIVTVTLDTALTKAVAKKTRFSGSDYTGSLFVGELYEDAVVGDTEIKLKYAAGTCMVGAFEDVDRVTDGCLFFYGSLTDGTNTYSYTLPKAQLENTNERTLQGLATAVGSKMLFCASGCPEINASYFMDYYGVPDFGDMWVQAALSKGKTEFDNGNANFGTEYDGYGIIECTKKGVSYVTAMLYALHEFEASVNACIPGQKFSNYNSLHKWDEGVAFYAGSTVGPDATLGDGKFSWALANKRCKNFRVCGPASGEVSGIAHINYQQLENFNKGKEAILQGDCDGAEAAMMDISELIYIPLVQGTLRYAFKVATKATEEKGQGEGAAFALGILPRIHAESPAAAKIIYDAMGVNRNPVVDYAAVKGAFESVYDALNIDCEQVGGYLNADYEFYTSPYPETAACVTKCSDNKEGLVPLEGFGLGLTCKQLNNLDAEWRTNICADHGGAAVCPQTCGDKCLCTDDSSGKFVKNNDGKTMSCKQLSRKRNFKSICKKKAGAKEACPRTCKGWCTWDDAFAQ